MSDDPLEKMLAPVPQRPEFRERLRGQTTRLLVQRRRLRRLIGATATAACLGLVVLAAWLLLTFWRDEQSQVARVGEPLPVQPAPREELPPPARRTPAALALEWQAFDSPPPERATRYLEAGNRYVAERQDYISALRCYQQALEQGGETLEIQPGDSWLVMALKMDQRKEN